MTDAKIHHDEFLIRLDPQVGYKTKNPHGGSSNKEYAMLRSYLFDKAKPIDWGEIKEDFRKRFPELNADVVVAFFKDKVEFF